MRRLHALFFRMHDARRLYRSKFQPVMYKGKPVDVDYTFTITLNCK